MSAKKVYFDTLRSLAFGSISGTYAALGTPFTVEARIICFTNKTQGDMILSTDNTNVDGQIFLPAGAFKLYDLTANLVPGKDDNFVIAQGTQFYVKQVTAPVSGSVYIENVYA
ncbi:MAG: hypothetical protein ACH349_01415 [Candidatus Rhabdochlamydia sp.]